MQSLQKAVKKAILARQDRNRPLADAPSASVTAKSDKTSSTVKPAVATERGQQLPTVKPPKSAKIANVPESAPPPPGLTRKKTISVPAENTVKTTAEHHADSKKPAQSTPIKPGVANAYQLLLNSSPDADLLSTPPQQQTTGKTPNPFGSQRKAVNSERAQREDPADRTERANSTAKDEDAKSDDAAAPPARRSLRGWFTPDRDANAPVELPPEPPGLNDSR